MLKLTQQIILKTIITAHVSQLQFKHYRCNSCVHCPIKVPGQPFTGFKKQPYAFMWSCTAYGTISINRKRICHVRL